MYFRYTNKDALLVGLSVAELCLLLFAASRFSVLEAGTLALIAIVAICLNCTNYQCVAHNFIHTPFFAARRVNDAFSIFNTLALGFPQSLYRVHHLHHHRFNNMDNDPSSIYRKTRDGKREPVHILWYSFMGPFRSSLTELVTNTTGIYRTRLYAECAALGALWVGLFVYSPAFFVFFYAPVWYLGHVVAFAENYLEHYGATPGNRAADSVSCYGRLYNLLWFNNGFHQEHHCQPSCHWTRVPEVRKQMLSTNERCVVAGAHAFNPRAWLKEY